jgi:hypothetical protein
MHTHTHTHMCVCVYAHTFVYMYHTHVCMCVQLTRENPCKHCMQSVDYAVALSPEEAVRQANVLILGVPSPSFRFMIIYLYLEGLIFHGVLLPRARIRRGVAFMAFGFLVLRKIRIWVCAKKEMISRATQGVDIKGNTHWMPSNSSWMPVLVGRTRHSCRLSH